MTRQDYRDMLPVVNSIDHYERLQAYATARIEVLRSYLETESNAETIKRHQGAIAELRRIATLREEVIEKSKDGR